MTIYVFTGPTLSAEQGRQELDAIFLPPAAQGDVYRAALSRPVAIGIIDGYFERIPSVSHKEVLWAMSQGVHVLGAASMGALRAAELAHFGMEGVGDIFEAFQRGELEADDEVALIHADAGEGYRPLSEPMVDIRATLRAAEQSGVIGAETRAAFERIAKGLFYPDRGYQLLLKRAEQEGVAANEREALQAFLPKGRVSQKRLDALALLRTLRERYSGQPEPEPKRVRYHFEHTDAWEFIRTNAKQQAFAPGAGVPDEALLELKRRGGYEAARRGALARALALEVARKQNRSVQGAALQEAVEGFRRARGLFDGAGFQRWLEQQGITDVERFFQDEANLQWAEALFGEEADRLLADHLRSTGEYAALKRG